MKNMSHRIISALLLLSMLLGLLPAPPARAAVTEAEKSQAESLQADIADLSTLVPKNQKIDIPSGTTEEEIAQGNEWLKSLDGTYFVVMEQPNNGVYYAVDPTTPVMPGTLGAAPVQVVGESVVGTDPSWAITMEYLNMTGSSVFPTTTTTARTPYALKLQSGKYLSIDKEKSTITHVAESNSTIGLFVGYVEPYLRIQHYNDYTYSLILSADEGQEPYFKIASAATNDRFLAIVNLYELRQDIADVEPLYNAINRAKEYLDTCNPYEEASYQAFLTALDASIDVYEQYNGNPQTDVSAAESAISAQIGALEAAMLPIMSYTEQIDALDIPYTEFFPIMSSTADMDLAGVWYLLAKDASGFYWTMDKDKLSGGTLGATLIPVSADGSHVTAKTFEHTVEFFHYTAKNTTVQYTILLEGANFLVPKSATNITLGKPDWYLLPGRHTTPDGSIHIRRYFSTGVELILQNGRYTFVDIGTAGTEQYLYRPSPATMELYNALQFVKRYGHGNANEQYPVALYDEFVGKLKACMSAYLANNNDQSAATLAKKAELDEMAADLRTYADKLTLADTKTGYIDIPIEVLDFRSDTFLLEYATKWNRYGLCSYSAASGLVPPGELYTDPGGTNARTKLTLDQLVDGQLVYTEETVAFIASAIMGDDDSSGEQTSNMERFVYTDYLEDFRVKINEILELAKTDEAAAEGSFADTLTKVTPNADGEKVNGCMLPWASVTTAFDLAYYGLNNLWRSVDPADVMSDGTLYNMFVPERDRLRLYKNDEGYYTIDSNYDLSYNGTYIYNSAPHFAVPKTDGTGEFTPVNGLGYEKGGVETDTGSYFTTLGYQPCNDETNFHFTIHAAGSFVYYEDQDLQFYFEGDDDVYFFINGQRVMDLGGAHNPVSSELHLNDIAKDLGLVEKGVYSFDMFYAERHTNGSNMRFSTNMNIVDTEMLTTKGQYIENDGVSVVTGTGSAIIDNALVNIGDTIAYSFDILNMRAVPVFNVSFIDNSLGTNISKDNIKLYDPALTNGAVTDITDISVFYRTYDVIAGDDEETWSINASNPSKKTYDQMVAMLNTAKEDINGKYRIPTGSYWVEVETVEQLKALLELGTAANSQMSVYGFKRNTTKEDRPYTNTVRAECYYRRITSGSSVELSGEFQITGSASRVLQVPDVEAITKPTADPEQVVIDYSKKISIPIKNLKNHIYTNRNVPVLELKGLTAEGYNGAVLKTLPDSIGCETVGSTYESTNALYTRTADSFEVKLTGILSEIERVYAVYEIGNYYVLSDDGKSTQYKYILVELQVIPATLMYYETDMDAFRTKVGNDVLFFDFDNAEEDRLRYGGENYCGNNFDTTDAWTLNTTRVQKREVDNESGSLILTARSSLRDAEWPDVFVETAAPVNYNPKNAEVYIVRFKLENFVQGTQYESKKNLYIKFSGVKTGTTEKVLANADNKDVNYSADYLTNGQYITLQIRLNSTFRELGSVERLRLYFGGVESDPVNGPGRLIIDYVYIGPEASAPMDDHLFLDFNNTEEDRQRYATSTYGNTNYDLSSSWKSGGWFTPEVKNGALVATPTTKQDEKSDGFGSFYCLGNMNYSPKSTDYAVIRLKIDGAKQITTGKPVLRLCYKNAAPALGDPSIRFTIDPDEKFDNGYFILKAPLNEASTVGTIKFLMLALYGVRSVDLNKPAQYSIDYIFIGSEADSKKIEAQYHNAWKTTYSDVKVEEEQSFEYATDTVYEMPKDIEVIPENAFFVDFDGDTTRYTVNPLYGGLNFDQASNAYWATSVSDSATAFTIDNKAGTMAVNVSSDADPNGNYGPFVATTNSYGNYPADSSAQQYFPLTYMPTETDFIQLRFKIDDCAWSDVNPQISFVYNYTTDDGYAYAEDIVVDYETTVMGDYQTVKFSIPQTSKFATASIVNSFGLRFGGLMEATEVDSDGDGTVNGRVTIDYFYVGPSIGMSPSGMSTNAMFIGFDNTDSDDIRYSASVYPQDKDCDAADGWNESSWMTHEMKDGAMILKPTASHETKSDGFAGFPSLTGLNYHLTGNDYVQMRIRIDGAKQLLSTVPNLKFWYGTGDYSGLNQAYVAWNLTPSKCFDQGYVTLTAALSTAKLHKELNGVAPEVINFIVPCLYAVRSVDTEAHATYTVDYIYIGPMDGSEIIQPSSDVLFYDFNNTDADKYRYSGSAYGAANFDDPDNLAWTLNTSRVQNIAIDNTEGTLTLTAHDELSDSSYPDVYTQNLNPLSFNTQNAEIYQVRFKLENFVRGAQNDSLKSPYINLQYFEEGATTATSALDSKFYSVDYLTNGKYITLTCAIKEDFRELGTIDCLRLYFGGIESDPNSEPGKLTIDYVYIGPTVEAKPVADSLFFGFDDLGEDRERYNSDTYGYTNYDLPPNWLRTSKITTHEVDNNAGFLKLTSKVLTDGEWPDAYVSTANYRLDYKPDNAEVFQMRFKLENFVKGAQNGTATNPYINLKYNYNGSTHIDAFATAYRNYTYIPMEALTSGQFVTLTVKLSDVFRNHDHIDMIRLYFGGIECETADKLGVITIDYVYIGPRDRLPQEATYGFDASYEDDTKLSDGSSLFVTGTGVTKLNKDYTPNYAETTAYTETSFTFTGTGFDIISRTGTEQGALRAMIYDQNGKYVKAVSVVNKSNSNWELYQVPVISVNDLTHGTYNVKIFVNAPYDYGNDGRQDIYKGDLDRGGEFYFDAVRIYNTIDTAKTTADATAAYAVYQKYIESDPQITEIRKVLIDTGNYNAGGEMEGALYLDKDGATTEIGTYTSLGPNNETYLAPGQAVAFKLVASKVTPKSVDIAAKSADGNPVNLTIGTRTAAPTVKPTKQENTITSTTPLYYPITVSSWKTDSSTGYKYVYITVSNAGDSGILSITDVKCAYDVANKVSKSVRFVVDHDLLNVLAEENGEPEPDENLSLTTNITAGAEMNVAYSLMASSVNSYKDFYLEVTKNVAGGEPITTVYSKDEMTAVTNPTSGEAMMYCVTYEGINAKEMGDSFSATLCAVDEDGSVHRGETVVSSIKDFLMGRLADESAIPEMKTMAVDMLRYGAAAQVRLGYDTENLVTADLTEEQLVYATQTMPEAVDRAAVTGEGANVNTNITVGTRVELNLSCIYADAADTNNVKCVITDTDGKVLAELAATNIGSVMYSASYDNVGAKEMRKIINATFYDGETAISKTVSWSVESYVAQTRATATANEIAMVNAMLVYGDSVAAYMAAK